MNVNSRIIAVSDDDFAERVLKAPGVVAVDFWAPWCAPCLQIKPFLAKLELDFRGSLSIVTYNRDLGRAVYDQLELQGIPNIVFFSEGEIIGSVIGGRPYKELKEAFIEAVAGHAQPRAIMPEMEELFEQTVAGLAERRETETAPARATFKEKADPVLARIRPAYQEALTKRQSKQITEGAYQVALKQYQDAFEAELGVEYRALQAACAQIDAKHDESVAYLIATFEEQAAEIYDQDQDQPTADSDEPDYSSAL